MPDQGQVQMSDLKTRAAEQKQLPTVTPGYGDAASFDLMQRGARVLSQSSLVPPEYQGPEGLPNAIVALNMALRMDADPLMVMQNLYIVHNRPAWSAQFLIGTFNRCGRYSAIRYEWQGKQGDKNWGCRAWAIERETGQRVNGPLITMQMAEAEEWVSRKGSKWKTIPELMLTYRAAAWMIRTNAPEIALGLPTAEEIDDVVTLTPDQYTVERVKADARLLEERFERRLLLRVRRGRLTLQRRGDLVRLPADAGRLRRSELASGLLEPAHAGLDLLSEAVLASDDRLAERDERVVAEAGRLLRVVPRALRGADALADRCAARQEVAFGREVARVQEDRAPGVVTTNGELARMFVVRLLLLLVRQLGERRRGEARLKEFRPHEVDAEPDRVLVRGVAHDPERAETEAKEGGAYVARDLRPLGELRRLERVPLDLCLRR